MKKAGKKPKVKLMKKGGKNFNPKYTSGSSNVGERKRLMTEILICIESALPKTPKSWDSATTLLSELTLGPKRSKTSSRLLELLNTC